MSLIFNLIFGISIFFIAMSMLATEVLADDSDLDFLTDILDSVDEDVESKQSNSDDESQSPPQLKIDNILQIPSWRDVTEMIVAIPEGESPGWTNLTRFYSWGVYSFRGKAVSIHYNFALNGYTRDDSQFETAEDVRFDIREGYLSMNASDSFYVDFGRINIKTGVSMGYNPTDYFKVNSVVDRTTEDVSQLRDSRMGALVVRSQKLSDNSSFSIALSPEISHRNDRWYTDEKIYGLNLDKNNDRSRVLIKYSYRIYEDFSPEMVFYNESGNNNFGLNLIKTVGEKIVAYAEANVGKRYNLIDEALLEIRKADRVAAAVNRYFPSDAGTSYRRQLSLGASYTTDSNISTNLEYHYNQSGLSKDDWGNWFKAGADPSSSAAAYGQLLSIRDLARIRNEPISKHSLFIRSQVDDVFVNNLTITGQVMVDLIDYSSLFQLEALYNMNSNTLLAFRHVNFNGTDKSNYGSLPYLMTTSIQLDYYFM